MTRRLMAITWVLLSVASTIVSGQNPVSLDTAEWKVKIRQLPSYEDPASRWEKNRNVRGGEGTQKTATETETVTKRQPEKHGIIPNWVNKIIRILLIAVGAIFLFLLFRNIRIRRIIQSPVRPDESVLPETTLTAFTEPWFLDRIAEARRQQDLIQVIRYQFLYALWLLHKNNLVDWRKGKTNAAYRSELQPHPPLQSHFIPIAQFYELIWYGGYRASESILQAEINKSDAFLQIIQSLATHA